MSSKHRIPFTVTPHAESQPEACNLQASPPSAHSSAAAALMRRRLLQPGSLCDLHAQLSFCPSHKTAAALCSTGKFRRRNPVALAKAVPCSMHAEWLHLRHTPVDTHVFRAACTTKRNTKRAQQVSLASCWLAVCKTQETDSGRIDHGGLGFFPGVCRNLQRPAYRHMRMVRLPCVTRRRQNTPSITREP